MSSENMHNWKVEKQTDLKSSQYKMTSN